MKTSNTNPETTNPQPAEETGELVQCSRNRKNGERCRTKFRTTDPEVTACYAHRGDGVSEPVREEMALALPNRTPDMITFRVNVGKQLVREALAQVLVMLAAAVRTRIGMELKADAFTKTVVGTKDSAVIMPRAAAQFVLMAFPKGNTGIEVPVGEGKYTMKCEVVTDETWKPHVITEKCAACWAGGRVYELNDENRWVVMVRYLAAQNHVKHEEVTTDDVLNTSVCPRHGQYANGMYTETLRKAGKIGPSQRVYVYNPYAGDRGEASYIAFLARRVADRTRTEKEFTTAFADDGGVFTLGDVIAKVVQNDGRRSNGKPEGKHYRNTKGGRRHHEREDGDSGKQGRKGGRRERF